MYISYLLGVFVFLKSNSVVINQFSYEKQGCIFLNLEYYYSQTTQIYLKKRFLCQIKTGQGKYYTWIFFKIKYTILNKY